MHFTTTQQILLIVGFLLGGIILIWLTNRGLRSKDSVSSSQTSPSTTTKTSAPPVPTLPPDEGTSKKKKGKNWFKWAFNWVVFLTIWGALAAIIVMAGIGVHKYVYVPFRQDMHRGLMEAQSGPTAIAHSWPNQVAVFTDRWSEPIASSTQGPIEWQLLEKNTFLDVLVNEQDIYRMYPIEDARWAPLQVTNVMTLRFRSVPIKGNRLWPPEKVFIGWKQH